MRIGLLFTEQTGGSYLPLADFSPFGVSSLWIAGSKLRRQNDARSAKGLISRLETFGKELA